MLFVIFGVLLVVLKTAGLEPVSAWTWWWVISPFVIASAWWTFCDLTGITERRALALLEKEENRRRNNRLMWLKPRSRRSR